MKTIGILVATIFCTMQLVASELIITGQTPKPFNVTINGRTYFSHGGSITITNLHPNNYRIAISSKSGKSHHSYQSIEYIRIPANSIVYAKVYPNNKLDITNTTIIRSQKVYAESRPARQCAPQYYERGMSQSQFEILYDRLTNIQFDSDRAKATRRAILDNNVTANQAYDLVNLFNFEEYRLEIAKLAYDKTIDKNNFYSVFELLSFESSKRELENYMNEPGYYRAPTYSYSER